MGSRIFRMVWRDTRPVIEKACELIRTCYKEEKKAPVIRFDPTAEIDRLTKKKAKLIELYTDESITREEFTKQRESIDRSIEELKRQQTADTPVDEPAPVTEETWTRIRTTLDEMMDFSGELIDRDVYRKFVGRIQVVDKSHFVWYLNLDGETTEEMEMLADGRKTNPTIMILDADPNSNPAGADGDASSAPLHIINGKIHPEGIDRDINSCYNNGGNIFDSLLESLHRPRSSRRNKSLRNPLTT